MDTLLQSSRATADFKTDVASYFTGERTERVNVETYVPRVKVQRLLAQLLAAEPSLVVERVAIRGKSGCSDFAGSVNVQTPAGEHVFDFVWCCRWRADTEGYTDHSGFPDQMRAAQEYDWRCFQRWDRRVAN